MVKVYLFVRKVPMKVHLKMIKFKALVLFRGKMEKVLKENGKMV